MFRRSLSEKFVDRLRVAPFWPNVVANTALQPEIRDEYVTIYCRGSGLIQDLRLDGDRWTARTHATFIPVEPTQGRYLELRCDNGLGLQFSAPPTPRSPALLSDETLTAFLGCLPKKPEDILKDAIIRHEGNQILDQEIAFADSSEDRDRVDLCAFLPDQEAMALVEIKRIEDERLLDKNGQVEVIAQLGAYAARLSKESIEILAAYQNVVRLKRLLGLGDRLRQVPEDGPISFLAKPMLVIGGCTDPDVDEIKMGHGRWASLVRGLPEVSSGLILCGKSCKLVLDRRFRNVRCFDQRILNPLDKPGVANAT